MVWCSLLWCGIVWYGVGYGMMWCGMVWYLTLHCMVLYPILYYIVWYIKSTDGSRAESGVIMCMQGLSAEEATLGKPNIFFLLLLYNFLLKNQDQTKCPLS